MHCWNSKSLRAIGNALGKYIDTASPKDQYSCARICVEVDLEAGLPEAIKLTVGNWAHFQKLDYEQLPFKCRGCHEYGHFARNCPKKPEIQQNKAEGWHKVNRAKSKNHPVEDPKKGEGNRSTVSVEGSQEIPPQKIPIEVRDESNEIEAKSSNGESKETGATSSDIQRKDQEENPTLAKEGDNLGQSEEEQEPESDEEEEEEGEIELSTPRRSKSKGRKSKKELRDQATYKDKLQGSQLTIEKMMKNTRNTRQQGHAQKGMPIITKSK